MFVGGTARGVASAKIRVMKTATFLKDTREAANMSLAELAAVVGMSQPSLTAYERGVRTPRVDQVDQILAGLGLQLRLEAEPLWADVDAAIDAAAVMPVAARLERFGLRPLSLIAELTELADLPLVVEGLCAAALLGAPVRVAAIDVVLPRDTEVLDRFSRWAVFHARRWSERWSTFSYAAADPREGRDPLRYKTDYGELRLRLVDTLPDSIEVQVAEQVVRVLDLRFIEATDQVSGRVLQRMQERMVQ